MSLNPLIVKMKQIKRELTALKTSHQRPLGTLDFFSQSSTFNVNLSESGGTYLATIDVIVTIETPTTTPPIVQTGWDTPQGFYRVQFLDFNVSNNFSQWTYKLELNSAGASISSATMKITAISSQPVQSITWSYA